jgi:RNA polymerase sigma factor (sigma-70 family)
VDIWNRRDHLSDTDSITYYLFAALKRRILKELNRHKTVETGITLYQLHISEFNSEELMITEEISDEQKVRINAAMKKLSKRQREVIRLKYFQNLRNEELAQRLSIKVESAYNLVSKSLSILRKHLNQVPFLIILFRVLQQVFGY